MKEKEPLKASEEQQRDYRRSLISPSLSITIETFAPREIIHDIHGFWLAEHLYVAAISDCLGAVFLAVSRNSKLDHISFQSNAVGIVRKEKDKYVFKKIILRPILKIAAPEHIEKAIKVIEMSRDKCLAAKAVTILLTLEPNIIVQSREAV